MKTKKKIVRKTISHSVISYKLDEIKDLVHKNSKDIEELKKQVAMGKGGIKAIFVIGSLVALILALIKMGIADTRVGDIADATDKLHYAVSCLDERNYKLFMSALS